MSWIDKLLPPQIQHTDPANRKSVPEGLWVKCPSCEIVLYSTDIEGNLSVCPKCSHHMRIGARQRLDSLLDPKGRHEIGADIYPIDPLKFKDSKKYPDRLKEASDVSSFQLGQEFSIFRAVKFRDRSQIDARIRIHEVLQIEGKTHVMVCTGLGQRHQPAAIEVDAEVMNKIGVFAGVHSTGMEIDLPLPIIHLIHTPDNPFALGDLILGAAARAVIQI